MLGAVKKRAESDFSANRPYSLTITVLTVSKTIFYISTAIFIYSKFFKSVNKG